MIRVTSAKLGKSKAGILSSILEVYQLQSVIPPLPGVFERGQEIGAVN